MSVEELTNGIENLPPRREVRGGVNAKAWRNVAAAALVLAAASMLLSVLLFSWQRSEAEQRRDQNCELFEGDHRDEVEQLQGTYRFLLHPSGGVGLTRAVMRSLPGLERKALVDRAPDYCDAEGVGLPEPDPCFPRRPAALGEGPKVPFQRVCKRVPG